MKTHDLDVPRIGYVHSWSNTQNEGWVRAALDNFGVPYTYFGDIKLREGNLRANYDVIVFPHVGGTAQSMVNGLPKIGPDPTPYKKSELTPNLGVLDQADDIRGGMGFEGLMNLYQFVKDGGLLIVEGATSTIFPEYKLVNGVTVESPAGLFMRGSIVRGLVADAKSPIMYGYDGAQIPVYFSQDPVLAVGMGGGGGRGGAGGGAQIPGVGMNVAPNAASTQRLSPWEPGAPGAAGQAPAADAGAGRGGAAAGGSGQGGRGGSVAAWRPAAPTRRASSCASPRTPTRCCSRACSWAARRWPTARRWWTRRSAPATSSCSPSGPTGAGRPRAPTSWDSMRS